MARQPWRSRLIEALHRQGLPSAYVDRFAQELTEHATDLFLEDKSMDAQQNVETRLGAPEQLAAAAKIEFQRRTFAGRHPLATFVAGPIAVVIGAFLAIVFLVFVGCWLIDTALGNEVMGNHEQKAAPTAFELSGISAASLLVRFAPFAASAWLFVHLGRRSGRDVWSIVACGIVALVAVCFWSSVNAGTAPSSGSWSMGFGWKTPSIDQLLQAAVPFAFGAWVFWRSSISHLKSRDNVSPSAA